jgi:hypothetical protein
MSPFRDALKAAGHGEWVIETIPASGEVRLRKINDRALEVHVAIAPSTEDGTVLKAVCRVPGHVAQAGDKAGRSGLVTEAA